MAYLLIMLQEISNVRIADVREKLGDDIDEGGAISGILMAALDKWMEAGMDYDGPIRLEDDEEEDDDEDYVDDDGEDYDTLST